MIALICYLSSKILLCLENGNAHYLELLLIVIGGL